MEVVILEFGKNESVIQAYETQLQEKNNRIKELEGK